MTHEHPTEPRCATCDSVLVHAGAICHACADESHYGAPPRTSPLLTVPERDDDLLAALPLVVRGGDGDQVGPSSPARSSA